MKYKLTVTAATMAMAIGFCASGAMATETELNIFNWGNYTSPELIAKFEKEFNVKVTVTDYDSNDTALAKIRAGGHGFDIVVPSASFVPIWISEGLATAFETDTADGAFGPDHEYAPRREAFAQLLRDDGLVNLRDLVTWTHLAASDEQTVHAVYQQSYALVTWMSRCRGDELRTYLQLMLAEPAAPIGPARYLQLFEQAFGDIESLQQAWLSHERSRLAP